MWVIKVLLLVVFTLLVVICGWFGWRWFSSDAHDIGLRRQGKIVTSPSPAVRVKEEVTILSYNMGFAAGPVQHSLADDHPEEFFRRNLDSVVHLLKSSGADIALLQEVDLHSKRSHYVNQLEYIMKKTGWGYAAPVVDWDMFFPLRKEHRIRKATVVLSRYPIKSSSYRLNSAKSNFDNYLLNVFYYPLLWKSCMQHVQVVLGDKTLNVFNNHLCVWTREARKDQFDVLMDWIREENLGNNLVIGGDFNYQAYIKGTEKPEEDMEKSPFFSGIWEDIPGIGEAFMLPDTPKRKIHENITFPERNHRYDFMFFSKDFALKSSEVVGSIDASDHLPIVVKLRIK